MAGLRTVLELFLMDIKTVIGVLYWGNLLYSTVILSYRLYQKTFDNQDHILQCGLAKLVQALGWLLMYLRGSISDLLSVILGNSLLFIGYFMDGQELLHLIGQKTKKTNLIQRSILAVSIVGYICMELLLGQPNIRVSLSSISVFAILLIPTLRLARNENNGRFKKYLGSAYLFFILLLLPRAITSLLFSEMDLFTSNVIQNASFIVVLMIMFFSSIAMLLLMKEDAYDQTEKMAAMDFLTNIPNRRSFMLAASTYFEWHKRTTEDVSVLFLDIDYFKKVNDKYGHAFGDEVLVNFAGIIGKYTREADFFCRYGGEEFLIFLSSSNAEQGMQVCDRIHEAVEQAVFPAHPDFHYTISIGLVSGIPTPGEKLVDFIHKSDAAMYRAKETGRNRTVLYT